MDISSRITRKTNLEHNDSLSCFDGHCAQQHHNVYEVFLNFLKDTKPARILEIGTALGGFTMFLNIVSKELNLDIDIRTYDIRPNNWRQSMIESGIDFRIDNIFSEDWKSIDSEVVEYIQGDGTTIVLCDGGWKKGEFNVISNYIKPGDFILAHDYAENEEVFLNEINGTVWNWHEICYADVEEAIIRNNLVNYKKDIFKNAAWLCTQKQVN